MLCNGLAVSLQSPINDALMVLAQRLRSGTSIRVLSSTSSGIKPVTQPIQCSFVDQQLRLFIVIDSQQGKPSCHIASIRLQWDSASFEVQDEIRGGEPLSLAMYLVKSTHELQNPAVVVSHVLLISSTLGPKPTLYFISSSAVASDGY